MACLRLTERCATILLCVREEVAEAGDDVQDELLHPIQRLLEYVHVTLFFWHLADQLKITEPLNRFISSYKNKITDRS